jgi:hypothetical protein
VLICCTSSIFIIPFLWVAVPCADGKPDIISMYIIQNLDYLCIWNLLFFNSIARSPAQHILFWSSYFVILPHTAVVCAASVLFYQLDISTRASAILYDVCNATVLFYLFDIFMLMFKWYHDYLWCHW